MLRKRNVSRKRSARISNKLGVETLEPRRVLAAYISEFHFAPLFGDQAEDQYVELRGAPNTILEEGTYFIGIESADGVDELGDVHTVIDLGSQAFGANGFMVLLQSGNGYSVDPNANVLVGTDGFQGLAGGAFQADDAAKGIHAGSSTYLLVQSDVAPSLADDIDGNDDGVPDGAYLGWEVLDGFTTLPWVENVWPQRAYAPIVFSEDGVGDSFLPGATVVETVQQAYAGRIGGSTGYTADEWLSGNTVEETSGGWDFQFQHGTFGTPRPYAYGGRILDHIGAPNWFGSISGAVFVDSNSDGVQQAGELPIGGTVITADVDGPDDYFWETIEPNDYDEDTDLSNISTNVTLVTAGTDDVHLGFKALVVQQSFQPAGEHIFSHAGVGFFSEIRRLRMDFYRSARSVSIDVIGNSNLTDTYGRLEIFNKEGVSLGFVRTEPLGANERQTLSLTSANGDIAWALAYSEDSYLNSSPFGMLDTLKVEIKKSATTFNSDGTYSITPVLDGNYRVSSSDPGGYYSVYPTAGDHLVGISQNQIIEGVNFGFKANQPPSMANQSVSANELTPAGGILAALQVIRGYPTQELEFTILSGDQANQFAIDPATFELKSTRGDLDFESISGYQLEIRVQDVNEPGFSATATLNVAVTDQNEQPTVQSQEVSIAENSDNGTQVATLSATDPDSGLAGVLTWSIVGGNTDGVFAMDAVTGLVTVVDKGGLNFERNPTFSLTVRATDAGSPKTFGEGTLTVLLTDLDERPSIPEQTLAVDENSGSGTLVGQLSIAELDAGETLTWTVFSGDGQALFDVSSTGQVTVAAGAALNFEQQSSYTLGIEVQDSGIPPQSDSRLITIRLNDINDTPTMTEQEFFLPENSVAGTSVATVAAGDEDVGQMLTYSLTGGAHSDLFLIDAATGALTVAAETQLDFESLNQLFVEVTVTDNHFPTASASATIVVALSNVNEAPIITQDDFSIVENRSAGSKVAVIDAADVDAGDQLQYEILSQSQSWFEVDPSTGELSVAEGATIDFEGDASMAMLIRVTDAGGLFDEREITVAATDANDPPVLAQPLSDLNTEVGAAFEFTVPASAFTDEDAGDSLRYVATRGSGFSLPSWLSFDSATRTLSGVAPADQVGIVSIRISAVDLAGANAFDNFDLEVTQKVNPWHNASSAFDVNDDGFVTPIDALMVINYLNSADSANVPPGAAPQFGFLDINADDFVTPIDALMVINRLNSGEGEGEAYRQFSTPPVAYPSEDLTPRRKDQVGELLVLLAYDRVWRTVF